MIEGMNENFMYMFMCSAFQEPAREGQQENLNCCGGQICSPVTTMEN